MGVAGRCFKSMGRASINVPAVAQVPQKTGCFVDVRQVCSEKLFIVGTYLFNPCGNREGKSNGLERRLQPRQHETAVDASLCQVSELY